MMNGHFEVCQHNYSIVADVAQPRVICCHVLSPSIAAVHPTTIWRVLSLLLSNHVCQAMRTLLEAGADPDADDIVGSTLLMRAARLRIQPDKVHILLYLTAAR